MAIDDQPMNVYWSGKRTETINRSKINYKGSVAAFSDLPDTGNQKGDMYSVIGLNGENYIWNGTAWDSLGTSDANVVHKTSNEEIDGIKTFKETIKISKHPGIVKPDDVHTLCLCGGSNATSGAGAKIEFFGGGYSTSPGILLIQAGKPGAYKQMYLYPDGTWTWSGDACSSTSDVRLKTGIGEVDEKMLNAWGKVSWHAFKWVEAVKSKGESARLHFGLIAQDVYAVLSANGVDAGEYGLLCHVEHEASEENDSAAVDMWTIRYTEALALEAAFQRRRADMLEERIAVLETLVGGGRQ